MRVLMLTVSEPLANLLFNWSNVFVAVGAAFGLIGVIGIFAMGAAKEQFSNERISANEAAAERAKADAEIAKEGAASANARAAEANEKAKQAELALEQFKAPRLLTEQQMSDIAARMASFKGFRAVLGAVPASEKNTSFLNQILSALRNAGVDAFINNEGVNAELNPLGQNARLRMPKEGEPSNSMPAGVLVLSTPGNARAKKFSEELARALAGANQVAAAGEQDWRETWVDFTLKRDPSLTRDSKIFETAIVAVGDKP